MTNWIKRLLEVWVSDFDFPPHVAIKWFHLERKDLLDKICSWQTYAADLQ